MEILISFDPGAKYDIFEGTRLRKNIKGALELNNVRWVDTLYSSPNICHLISPFDESLGKAAKDEGVPLVVSALFAEHDPKASFLAKDIGGNLALTFKSKRVLELADLILVPSLSAKLFLEKTFPNKRIEVLSPGVNAIRFDSIDDIGQEIFCRYERVKTSDPYSLVFGRYEDKETLESLIKLAALCPSHNFFFIGGDYGAKATRVDRFNKKAPKNLRFLPVISDDLYRSAMKGASYFIQFDTSISCPLVTLEAIASKTKLVQVGKPEENGFLSEKDIRVCLADEKETANYLFNDSPKSEDRTIIEGQRIVKEHSLKRMGEELIKLYNTLL